MRLLKTVILLAGIIMGPAAIAASPEGDRYPPTIAIIIDDMGHNLYEGQRLANMEQPLTLAFLPYRKHTTSLAKMAYQQNKEIMLHAPMANTRNFGLAQGGLPPIWMKSLLPRHFGALCNLFPMSAGSTTTWAAC